MIRRTSGDARATSASTEQANPAKNANRSARGWLGDTKLVLDTFVNFLRLLRVEASLSMTLMPRLLLMGLLRIFMMIISWLGFAFLLAVGVYTYTGEILVAVCVVVAVQLAGMIVVELAFRKICARVRMPESRKTGTMIAELLDARFNTTRSGSARDDQ